MKKRARILCLLVSALVVFAMFPLQATTATNYEKVFDKLKAEDVAKYVTPLPTKGAKSQSEAQINRELKKIGGKIPGNGSVLIDKTLSITAMNGVPGIAYKTTYYARKKGKNTSFYFQSECAYTISGEYPPANCYTTVSTSKKYTRYHWYKGESTGTYLERNGKVVWDPPTSQLGVIAKHKKMTNCKKYSDVKFMGQKCFVYSFIPEGSTSTIYIYVSRQTGQILKSVVSNPGGTTGMTISFAYKYGSKPASYFEKPKGIEFTYAPY